MSTLLITIIPSLLILLYFFLSDKFKEPKETIALVFVLGVLICLPAGIINHFMNENFILDGEKIQIQEANLPKISKIHLQPLKDDFSKLDINHKEALENAIIKNYQIININDILHINNCELNHG